MMMTMPTTMHTERDKGHRRDAPGAGQVEVRPQQAEQYPVSSPWA